MNARKSNVGTAVPPGQVRRTSYQADMAAFDALPSALRYRVASATVKLASESVRDCHRAHGPTGVRELIEWAEDLARRGCA